MTLTKRISEALARERNEPCEWMYISFCDEKFLGAVIIQAPGIATAILRCHQLGINPGGQALAVSLDPDLLPPPEARERLLTKEEVIRYMGPVHRVDSAMNPVTE